LRDHKEDVLFIRFCRFHRAVSSHAPALTPALRLAAAWQRSLIALALAFSLFGAFGGEARPAYAYNCVNVVLRDPYWGQYRRIVESGWNAAGVGSAFARSGFAVNNWPQAGDIIVWPAGYYGASRAGHVGVVAAVYGNGTVLVRHENWPFGTPEHFQVFAVRPGLQFVHRAVYRPTAVPNVSDASGTSDASGASDGEDAGAEEA
jgi:surface antigen